MDQSISQNSFGQTARGLKIFHVTSCGEEQLKLYGLPMRQTNLTIGDEKDYVRVITHVLLGILFIYFSYFIKLLVYLDLLDL